MTITYMWTLKKTEFVVTSDQGIGKFNVVKQDFQLKGIINLQLRGISSGNLTHRIVITANDTVLYVSKLPRDRVLDVLITKRKR